MKKAIALVLAMFLLLSFAACGKKAEDTIPVETLPAITEPLATEAIAEPETEPAPTEPAWESATSRVGYAEAVYARFDAGTQLDVVGQYMNYYVVQTDTVDLLVDKQMLRLQSEAAFESYTGYAKQGAEVFDNAYLQGEASTTLNANTVLAVLESNGDWAFVQWSEGEGYMKVDMISTKKLGGSSGSRSSSSSSSSSSGSSGSSGSSSSSSDGTNVSIDSLSSTVGTDQPQVLLLGAYYGPTIESMEKTSACVLANDVKGYVYLFNRGDEIKVTAYDDEKVTVWIGEEVFAELPRNLVKLAGDAQTESWTGYSRKNGVLYEEFHLRTEAATLTTNTPVTVLDELENCYIVEHEGLIRYMQKTQLSKTIISAAPAKSSSSGSSSSSSSTTTWTPPKW